MKAYLEALQDNYETVRDRVENRPLNYQGFLEGIHLDCGLCKWALVAKDAPAPAMSLVMGYLHEKKLTKMHGVVAPRSREGFEYYQARIAFYSLEIENIEKEIKTLTAHELGNRGL